MATRVIAIVILVMFLGFIGTLLSVGIFIRDPLPIVGANNAIMISDEETDPISARVDLDGGMYSTIRLGGDIDLEAELALYPVEAGMTGAIPLEISEDGDGLRAEGQITTAGRWQLDVETGAEAHSFQFIIRE